MTDPQSGALIWRSQDGTYFIVAHETLEQGRVSPEQTAELERLITSEVAEGGAVGEDTAGHVAPVVIVAGGLAFGYGVFAGNAVTNYILNQAEGGGGSGKAYVEAFQKGVQQGGGGRPPR